MEIHTLGKTIYLMDDIDMSTVCSSTKGTWVPIGTDTYKFQGTFNGNYHDIKNIYVNTSNGTQGLFGVNAGTIKNLYIRSGSVTGRGSVGAVVRSK